MKKFLKKIFLFSIIIGLLFGSLAIIPASAAVTYKVPTPIALYEDSLGNAISSTATSFTLVRGTDIVGTSLAASTYGFIIDEGSSSQEFVLADCTATACTNVLRGISPITGLTEVTSLKKSHRRGAVVKMTDAPILLILKRLLNGDETIPNKLSYASHPTFTSAQEIPDKQYVDSGLASGCGNADTTSKGCVEIATQAEVDAGTQLGGTGAYLVTNPALTRAKKYHDYAADAVGTDAYAITITPAITAYSTGQIFTYKALVANNGTASLNVSGLGAKTIKKSAAVSIGGSSTTQFDITNPSGTTFRYTFDGTGTDPAISTTTIPTGITLVVAGQNFNASNNGTFVVTGSGSNYFEVTNASGVAENDKTLGTGYINTNLSDLATGDILAGQHVTVEYDGNYMQLLSSIGGVTTTQNQITPTTQTFTAQSPTSLGDTTTRFDITNPSGTTFRYTWDGTGTDPGITTTTMPTGISVLIESDQIAIGNTGSFIVTGSGTNYFEVTNAGGATENDKTLEDGYLKTIAAQTYTKPAGLKYAIVETQGAGAGGVAGDKRGGGGGAYSRKLIAAASIGTTENVYVGIGGLMVGTFSSSETRKGAGADTRFGTLLVAPGGSSYIGGTASGGDLNIDGGDAGIGVSTFTSGVGGNSFLGIGGAANNYVGTARAGKGYGSGSSGIYSGTTGQQGQPGIVIVREFYN